MKRMPMTSFAALAGAVTFGIATTAAQAPQQEQQRPPQQEQQQQQGRSMVLTGCVYQASDQPAMFALRGMEEKSGASRARADSSAAGRTESSEGTRGTTGAGGEQTTGAAGTQSDQGAQRADASQGNAAWYRLSSSAVQDLKQYVGQGVRINGRVVPGRDEKGADIVFHQITPEKVTITALDLKPAPQFQVDTITPVQGQQCQQSTSQP